MSDEERGRDPGPGDVNVDVGVEPTVSVDTSPQMVGDEYVVGPGVLQAMESAGDEPRSDEQFIISIPGHQVSQTFGRDAVYYYYEEDNRTSRLPFR